MPNSIPLPARLAPGRHYPLGASWDGLGVNFAVFSAHAELIELCVFDQAGRRELGRLELPCCTDEVFHGYLPQAKPGMVYGLRAHGPYQPELGHRFNPNKLLLDPYAKKLMGELHWSDALFGYRVGAAREDLSFDRRDSAPFMPKAIVMDSTYAWGGDAQPDRLWGETVIYEAHLKGLTKRHPKVPLHERGSFAGLGNPFVIDYLKNLGVTAVELLPIHAFLQDRFLVQRGLDNYWGYSTLAFFAPEPAYLSASDGSLQEIRQTVRRLHDAGIELILDVVYNHTCEGSEMGPTLSWRGLDNLSYYQSIQGQPRRLVNDTGCGNTLNITHPRVLQMVMDSLRHWAEAYHVDGFRFDLGTSLGREVHGFDPGSGFFDAIRQDPVLSRMKLISEPWDLGPGGYQLGRHPPGFSEWNDRFRDTVRKFWRGDAGQRGELAARLLGSSDIFENFRRRTWASVNFVACHDGFTLHDLTAFADKHNEANGEENRDGTADNHAANHGVEGETDDAAVNARRDAVRRAMLATVFFSHGTPMLLAGDELGRTQLGNNNAYCQDNEISWLDWDSADAGLLGFTRRLTAIRAAHGSLRTEKFLHGRDEVLPGLDDVAWFDARAERLTDGDWADANAQLLIVRRAVLNGNDADITLTVLNGGDAPVDIVLPNPELNWEIILDSANPENEAACPVDIVIRVAEKSVLLLAAWVGV